MATAAAEESSSDDSPAKRVVNGEVGRDGKPFTSGDGEELEERVDEGGEF